jgi:hypothetical protein
VLPVLNTKSQKQKETSKIHILSVITSVITLVKPMSGRKRA